jgi:hypothetical protein
VLPKHWFNFFGLIGFSYFFDIGLRIKAENRLHRIRVCVPFDSNNHAIADLSNWILDSNFVPLIFGRPVDVRGNRISYEAENLGQNRISDLVIPVSSTNSSAEAESDPRFSVWNVEFRDPIPEGEIGYARFRLRIDKPEALWTSKGWGQAKRGMIADLRVADIRESNLLNLGSAEAQHIVPIKRLFLFLGAPSYFVPQHVSPQLHYSRLLEPQVWRKYLNANVRVPIRISIHQWRSRDIAEAEPRPVNIDAPYRAYMDVTREFGMPLLTASILVAALLAVFSQLWDWLLFDVVRSWIR